MRRFFRRYVLPVLILLLLYIIIGVWDIHRVGHVDRDRHADCAIVLGAAAWHDKPSPVLEERLNHAIELFKADRVKALILTGGYGKGAPFSESEVASDYCIKQGIPKEAIRIETNSQDTLGNLTEAKKIIDHETWKTALLVSDPWHLKRARKMSRDLGLKVYTSATPSSRFQSFGSRSKFLFGEFLMYHWYLITGK